MYDIRTNSGRIYNFDRILESQPPTIHEIAASLAKEQRFGGACCDFYSVAQHAVSVSLLVEESDGPYAAFYALHHDDHEFLVKDIPTPLKRWLADKDGHDHIGNLADQIDELIYTGTLDLPYPIPHYIQDAIDVADKRMYITEGKALVRNFSCDLDLTPAPFNITPQSWEQAEKQYLQRHTFLKARRGYRK